ncbi:ABC transporter permease [Rhodococcus sp. D2-41]|uniref:ABC transporter permease n=1 Tax=Speluncibacter jeojiensis TaxID=2710754 RepID=A0A9X4M2Q3_9ACTN|nr:ABC transporter permease [Rhodococcus sp. D2-41]MDG3011870.1 ABC transporter permease [Rhodococcus sp. D2-41]MDG3013321.1 ABC transporter permease [Corynebacteriales bacterium D3-21]
MTATTVDRRVPPLGGFSARFLGLELRRLLRNRRTVVFTLAMPPIFYLIFGLSGNYKTQYPDGWHGNVSAFVMISMAVYGAMIATTSGGAMVAVERAQGWSRQLRLTPLRPVAYVGIKVLVAMSLGLASVAIVFMLGALSGAEADPRVWMVAPLVAWSGSAVFAAFGLFVGYLLPSENVMQFLGPGLAVLAFAGGLFVPLDGGVFGTIAKFVPTYGLARLAHAALTGDSAGGIALAVVNIVVWAAVFVVGAAVAFRRDTQRV